MEIEQLERLEHLDSYRDDLAAARLRIEQLEDELALFRADPAYERVDIAEERLAQMRARRARLHRLLPRICVGSFAAMGAFALTNPALPGFVQTLGYVLCALGGVLAVTTMAWIVLLAMQGARPRRVLELERQVRIAKGDVGRVRVSGAGVSAGVGAGVNAGVLDDAPVREERRLTS